MQVPGDAGSDASRAEGIGAAEMPGEEEWRQPPLPRGAQGTEKKAPGTSGGQTSSTQVGAAGDAGIISCPWREFPRMRRVTTFRHWGQIA